MTLLGGPTSDLQIARLAENRLKPERLAHRPCLERASARDVRCVSVRNLRQVSDAGIFDQRQQRREKARTRFALRFGRLATDAQPRFDERPHQPRPYRPLVVRAISLVHAAQVVRRVCALAGRERSQSNRRKQERLNSIDDAARACAPLGACMFFSRVQRAWAFAPGSVRCSAQ
jgi:hypothetical protein